MGKLYSYELHISARRLLIPISLLIIILIAPEIASPAARFTSSGEKAVVDNRTGLMWSRDAMPADTAMPLQMARKFIEKQNTEIFGGYSDWRIPTMEELTSLAEEGSQFPVIESGHPFVNVRSDFYWTSSVGFNIIPYAWVVDMGSGAIKHADASFCNFFHVWIVRTDDAGKWDSPSAVSLRKASALDRHLPSYLDALAPQHMAELSDKPRAPKGVSAVAVSMEEINVSWTPLPSQQGSTWYNLYDSGKRIRSVQGSTVRIKGLSVNTRKCYSVSSRKNSAQESEQSREVCATTWKADVKAGTLWASGFNGFGQLGDGSRTDSRLPVLIDGLDNIRTLAAGVEHVLAVKKDGSVWAWGRNSRGQLGDGTSKGSLLAQKIEGLNNMLQVSAGWYHSIGLDSNGDVWAWGRNYYGQLGDGTTDDKSRPIKVRGLKNVIQIKAGWYHSMALKSDGTVWVWGWNRHGQLGDTDKQSSDTPIKVHGLKSVVAIAAGMQHSVALMPEGSAMSWGRNDYGQLANGMKGNTPEPIQVQGLEGAKYIDCSMHYCLALKQNNTVMGWGRNDYGQIEHGLGAKVDRATEIGSVGHLSKIAAGAHHAIGVRADGELLMWGWDFASDIKNIPPTVLGTIRGFNALAAGVHFSIMLKD